MVRVAALSDIHGNLPALEAVLADVERERVDEIVVVGDTICGPWPAETFDLLVDALHVRGNGDRLALEGAEGPIGDWSVARLGHRRSQVASWPLTVELDVEGLGHVLFCHAVPTADEPIFTRITPDADVDAMLGETGADVVVVGHTHVQFDRRLASGSRVVNVGSVGMPYEGEQGAYWALLGPDIDLRRTVYDVDAAVAAMRTSEAPNIEDQLIRYLLDPPDPEETTRYFESVRGS